MGELCSFCAAHNVKGLPNLLLEGMRKKPRVPQQHVISMICLKNSFSGFAARYVLWNVRPGSIIVLHDHLARGKRTASALATILPEFNCRGFRVVPLSELAASHPTDE